MFNLSDQGGSLLSGVLQVPFYFTKLVTLLVKLKKRETDESHDTKFISDHPNEIILKLFEETTYNYYMTLQVRWESYYVLHCSRTSNIWGNLSVFLANYLKCNRHPAGPLLFYNFSDIPLTNLHTKSMSLHAISHLHNHSQHFLYLLTLHALFNITYHPLN